MVLFIILGVVVILIAAFVSFLCIGLGLKDASIKNVDVSKLPDGTYSGKLKGSRFGNALKVTVSGGKIGDIEIVKNMAVVIPNISSKLFEEVKEKQSLQVDCVSQATVSCKAYLKSLENALEGKQPA